MSKENQRILVVERKILFDSEKHYFEGFREHHEHDYETKIISNLKILRRGHTSEPADHPEGNAERDYDHKQPIGYNLIVNPEREEVFVYQRASKDKNYNEKRLQGKWSCGVGGHIEHFENKTENPIRESSIRETFEEVKIIGNQKDPQVIGYINYDSDDVGKVHFGIAYVTEIDGNVRPKDFEMAEGKLIHISDLEEMCSSPDCVVEAWAKISLEPLKNYFEKYKKTNMEKLTLMHNKNDKNNPSFNRTI